MMNDPKFIHETVVKEIIDAISSIKQMASNPDLHKIFKNKSTMSYSSIAKASSNLTMVFPVLCSRNISIENSSMVSKALEKKFVTMLQMLFSSVQIANSDVKNVEDYIKQFHSNISTSVANLDDLFNFDISKFDVNKEAAVKEDMRNINYILPSDVNNKPISEMFTVNESYATVVDVDNAASFENNISPTNDKSQPSGINKTKSEFLKNRSEIFKKQVMDSEFKKANELMPTTMYVTFTVMPADGNYAAPIKVQDGVVGVKAKLYPLSSDDVIKHLVEKEQNKNWITNFIRASTREISFFKDFLFAIDKAKIDAMSLSDRKGSTDKMWKVLERRATGSKFKRALAQNNNMAAITTLVVSQDEIEYMKSNFNVDMEKLTSVLHLFSSLNLISFVIVDESLEVAKFIFDEQDPTWETISFNHLERESNDNTYKKVVNLMTKMR